MPKLFFIRAVTEKHDHIEIVEAENAYRFTTREVENQKTLEDYEG